MSWQRFRARGPALGVRRSCPGRLLAAAGLAVGAVALPAAPADAATVSVPCSVPALVNAIKTANSSPSADILHLAPGCDYVLNQPDFANPANGLPVITSDVTINGNGATIERQPAATAFRILFVSSTGRVTLNETTVSGGEATDCPGAPTTPPFPPGGLICGGGILNQGTLTVNRSRVVGNTAESDVAARGAGGAGLASLGAATLNNTEVGGNTARYIGTDQGGVVSGGGVASAGTLTVSGSRVVGNSVAVTPGTNSLAEAAGVSSFGEAKINSTSIEDNQATAGGGIARGALVNPAGVMAVRDSLISNNTTNAPGGLVTGGGGSTNGTISLIRSRIIGNHATGGVRVLGGGFNVGVRGVARLIDSRVSGNTASGAFAGGGGLANALGGTLTTYRTHISNNTAIGGTALGGGLFNATGLTTLNGSAVTKNTAGTDNTVGDGGGIYEASGTVTLNGTVVEDNSPNQCRPLNSVPGCTD